MQEEDTQYSASNQESVQLVPMGFVPVPPLPSVKHLQWADSHRHF